MIPDRSTLFRTMFLIRRFEETVLENFSKGVFFGTTHTSLGQEANAAGVLCHLQDGDVVFSNHRCHGHFLAYGGDPRALFAEMMGKSTGVCGGRGGSQHLHWRNFYSNGVQGGILPGAVGMALAEKRKGTGALVVAFLGDGTLGEGALYEALNLASLWKAPVLFVLEDNGIAQTTPVELAVAGSLSTRFTAFGIPVTELDSSDVLEISPTAGEHMRCVRQGEGPRALIVHTCRFGPHSKGDDTRSADHIARLRLERDPLVIHGRGLDEATRQAIEAEINQLVSQAYSQALSDPLAQDLGEPLTASLSLPEPAQARRQPGHVVSPVKTSVLDSLNAGLKRAMATDERVILLGEDILDPYGGAFKMTRGLTTAFPNRVITTPISEAGFTGAAGGMALRGLRPVVEIMFGDFSTLIADQVINHISKFRWMYNDQVHVPVVIRTPMGGRRGYGPTHSQTLDRLLLGTPGLRVLAPAALGDPGQLLEDAILHSQDPTLFIEAKLLYLQPVLTPVDLPDFDLQAVPGGWLLKVRGAPAPSLTITAYGFMAGLAQQAALRLAYESEIFAELYVPTQLAPFVVAPLLDSISRSGRLLTVEEGTLSMGWGAEICARAAEALGVHLSALRRVAALDLPIPGAGSLEQQVLPGVDDIVAAGTALSMV